MRKGARVACVAAPLFRTDKVVSMAGVSALLICIRGSLSFWRAPKICAQQCEDYTGLFPDVAVVIGVFKPYIVQIVSPKAHNDLQDSRLARYMRLSQCTKFKVNEFRFQEHQPLSK